jgi:hypothetical protein
LLDDAARQCEKAYALDRKDYGLRSCGVTYELLGKYDRAMDFVRLDAGSAWANGVIGDILLHEGKPTEALDAYKKVAEAGGRGRGESLISDLMLYAKTGGPPESKAAAQRRESEIFLERDPEPKYWTAASMAFVGQKDVSLRLLRSAVQGNYCQVYGLDHDPLFSSLRADPEFASIRSAAVECQQRFLAHRSANPPANP